ncbi:ABC transporter permease [Roseomonas marmotae]|uniref:ABC transporter permease subunit n=1 Tax=Roseomonas marmotae TaxID=2768161 RepID=A0ABS3KD69_9PROT|nr:ABC transporter permease subunit [Roseomonas marmotae]MBO1074870.1 ABC transporter permease subunit [Roseomonas marmotae]QTI80627.1 ABC transporter permease subunit [Roseomonas marmotae]
MRRIPLLVPALWLLGFVAAPLVLVLVLAISQSGSGVPPFVLPYTAAGGWQPNWDAFGLLLEDDYYLSAFLRSLRVAGVTAALCLLLGFPMALGIARAARRWRMPLLMAVLLPFWTGFMPRIGAWTGILRDQGWVNGVLRSLGWIDAPLPLLYSDTAMFLGMVHAYLPFAVLPLYASLSRLDRTLEDAAGDLGARPWVVFLTVTLPLAAPGALAAFLLVFIPAAGEYVIPELLGPPDAQLVGRVLWQEFFQNRDWPVASALAVALLLALILPIRLFQRLEARK